MKQKTDDLHIVPGHTRVRVLYNSTKEAIKEGEYRKSGMKPTWSSESYVVLSRNGVNSWVVDVPPGEVKIWPSYAIRVVSETEAKTKTKKTKQQVAKGERVDLVVESQKRAFAREISEEEQEANTLPEGKKRTRAKVNYNENAMADTVVSARQKKVTPVEIVSEEKEPTPAKKTRAKTKEAKKKEEVEPRRSTRERKQVERFGFPS